VPSRRPVVARCLNHRITELAAHYLIARHKMTAFLPVFLSAGVPTLTWLSRLSHPNEPLVALGCTYRPVFRPVELVKLLKPGKITSADCSPEKADTGGR